ncbi:hypothetical protein EJ08DRAFT_661548 [Tothia fuscella]|uniref:Ubiquitination network signaling protein n=1 Tax=Tothia fuscella TaxID=1048955 RepID=A0A9P4NPF2_9PEZI|nr:hypothetical protein EJ08DRAFT_661548 [Tothia fuscella]
MPPRLKRVGNSHDKTNNHQAGLAAPGRRITKQKSVSSLNGHPIATTSNGRRSTLDVDVEPLPTLPNNSAAPSPSDQHANDPSDDYAEMGVGQSHHDGGTCTVSGVSDADLEAHGSGNGTYSKVNGSPLTIDVKAAAGSCAHRPQKSMLATATTILKACPLWDVIAILIILLQLPPTIVSVVQFLFALLTFVPPVSGTSLANLPSLNEVLVGASGAPSFQTIVLLDTAMFIFYLCVPWTSAQNLALDLAQMVIAISLGGAAASSSGTSNSIFCCLSIIGFSHIIRMNFARQIGMNAIWALITRSGFRPPPDFASSVADFPDKLHVAHSWPRKLLGVHILTQGVVRLVRRWYLYSAAMNDISANKKGDPEIGSLSTLSTPRTTTSSFGDSGPDMTGTSSSDGRPPGPSPAAREKDRISNSKKKKKQANHVRSQQPFWAAVANAKVTFLKELEQQQASMDSVEANSMDITNIGNADFKNGKDRVWIKEVGATEISFGVCLLSKAPKDDGDDEAESAPAVKRFRLRLNRTDWSSTRISEESLGMAVGEWQVDEWSAKIFGLTPSTNYICEFIRMDKDGAVFCTTHITTGTAPSTEQAPTPPAAQTQSLRPLSPKTTLKNSIQAAEQQLEAQRNRLKRNKRDHKNTLTGLQKDVDSLKSRLENHGGNDDRQRQKARQLEQSYQQAKAKESEIYTQISELKELPADEKEEASHQRASWRQEKARLSTAREAFNAAKDTADRDISQAKAEITSLKQKHQKFEQRQTKYNEQHSRLVAETSQGQEAQARRFHERSTLLASRSEDERRYLEQTALCDREAQTSWSHAALAETESKHLEDLYNRVIQQSVPTTPEGPLPGTRNLPNHQNAGFPALQSAFQFPPPGFNNINNDNALPTSLYGKAEKRGRSSSMLSGVSGFTDDLDDSFLPSLKHTAVYAPANGVIGRERRKSSAGSGVSGSTGSGQSSGRDPLSPPPTSGLKMGSSPFGVSHVNGGR